MSLGPQPSSSPNHPIQRLTLFTDVTIDIPDDENAGNEATTNSIERFATIPDTPYLAHDISSTTDRPPLHVVGESQNDEGYALGMEYDVLTTQYTTHQLSGNDGSGHRKSSYRPNAHLELITLSNSTLARPSIDSLAFSSTKRYSTGSVAGSIYPDGIANNVTLEGELTEKAVSVVHRVMDKLIGLDFENKTALEISEQIDRLIQQATSTENLSACFSGWCAFW